jgi:hypothetical protein
MSKHEIAFARSDWKLELPTTAKSCENTVWTAIFINFSHKVRVNVYKKVRANLSEEFSSIVFIGSAPLYFYFTDTADETFFMLKYTGNEFDVSI